VTHECDRQTDGQADGFAHSINRASLRCAAKSLPTPAAAAADTGDNVSDENDDGNRLM